MRIPITDWLEPGKLNLLRGWARDGLTDEQIAARIGITRNTLGNWKKYPVETDDGTTYPIAQALRDGKEVVDYFVESALLRNAMSGDTTAQIFWLKNRQPDKWRDRGKTDDKPAADPADIEPAIRIRAELMAKVNAELEEEEHGTN